MSPGKPRVLYLLRQYPLISETYIQAEIDALNAGYEIRVATQQVVPEAVSYMEDAAPYRLVKDYDDLLDLVDEFQPDILHMHWLLDAEVLLELARETGLPFTIRAHSFDTLPAPYMLHWFESAPRVLPEVGRDELCRGILAFPFSRPWLERCGIPPAKIHDCFPPVDVARFMNRAPNGEGVINVGAGLPKKDFPRYIELAARMPHLTFDLYPVGHETEEIAAFNRSRGSPVRIHQCVRHREMPAIYKAHRWLVYTISPQLNNVGWPVSVAEAQASGCGVALANVRPDLRDYLGEGGILFDRIEELIGVIDKPVPEAMREAGFAQARKSDVRGHIGMLTRLWK